MTNRLIRRATVFVVAAVLGGGVAVAAASPAQAAGCYYGTASVASPSGGTGATAAARLCINSYGVAWLDTNTNNYIKDQKADGYAARAYIYWSQQYTNAIAVDDTSTAGGASLHWESNAGTQYRWTEVWVCLGYARPQDNTNRCAVVVYGT
ncbi:hypothetical protein [Micromonospora sp. NPDC051296]|uniref:hypothetical protein n=1 Tax=Micromonospora sp. NPDC051296 TaxID=3155046 RepID=UPI0034450AD9